MNKAFVVFMSGGEIGKETDKKKVETIEDIRLIEKAVAEKFGHKVVVLSVTPLPIKLSNGISIPLNIHVNRGEKNNE